MALFIRTSGTGTDDIVLLHGWGFHGAVWNEVAETLVAQGRRVHQVDLPGHGHSPPANTPMDIDALAEAVQEAVPSRAVWVGWSLGGMVAQAAAAMNPTNLRALVLVATTPRFVRGPDWPAAMDPALLAQFGHGLTTNWRATLSRFLAIQSRALRVRATMFHPAPDPGALANGLVILQNTDLRSRLSAIVCPTLVLLGERDTLVPIEVSKHWSRLRPDWRIQCLSGAGHMPFLTHHAEVSSALAEHGRSD